MNADQSVGEANRAGEWVCVQWGLTDCKICLGSIQIHRHCSCAVR